MCACLDGAQSFIECIGDFVSLLSDSEETVRINGYVALIKMSEFLDIRENVVQMNVIEVLIDKLVFEKSDIVMKHILILLGILCDTATSLQRLLKTSVISRLKGHIKSKNMSVAFNAIHVIYYISCKHEGKKAIFKDDMIPILFPLINEADL